MEIKYKKIKELIPYVNNQKLHPEQQVLKISNSIKEFGFIQPIVINKDNIIVIGHGRYEGAKLLDMDKVPCILVDNLDEAKVKALRIADNKLNESMWDDDLLKLELLEIEEMGFDYSDIMEFDFDDISDDDVDDNLFEDEEEANSADAIKLSVTCENNTDKQQLKEELLSRGYICQ